LIPQSITFVESSHEKGKPSDEVVFFGTGTNNTGRTSKGPPVYYREPIFIESESSTERHDLSE
jgi:hypothetical protein